MDAVILQSNGLSLPPLATYFAQLGYVADDVDKTATALGKSLGVDFARASGTSEGSDVRFRGRPHVSSVLLAFAMVGGIEIEIIQPLSDDNIYTEHLERHGPGLHHAGFKIPTIEQFRGYYDLLRGNGSTPVLEGRVEGNFGVEFCYFDCSAFGASFIEITHFFRET